MDDQEKESNTLKLGVFWVIAFVLLLAQIIYSATIGPQPAGDYLTRSVMKVGLALLIGYAVGRYLNKSRIPRAKSVDERKWTLIAALAVLLTVVLQEVREQQRIPG